LVVLAYLTGIFTMVIYSIPGFQAESIGLGANRDSLNKQYASPISTNVVFGLTILAIIFYVITIVHIIMMVIYISKRIDMVS
jgi:hypothetical protein